MHGGQKGRTEHRHGPEQAPLVRQEHGHTLVLPRPTRLHSRQKGSQVRSTIVALGPSCQALNCATWPRTLNSSDTSCTHIYTYHASLYVMKCQRTSTSGLLQSLSVRSIPSRLCPPAPPPLLHPNSATTHDTCVSGTYTHRDIVHQAHIHTDTVH